MVSSQLTQGSFGAGFPWTGPTYQPQMASTIPMASGAAFGGAGVASSFASVARPMTLAPYAQPNYGFQPVPFTGYSPATGMQAGTTSLSQFFGPYARPTIPATQPYYILPNAYGQQMSPQALMALLSGGYQQQIMPMPISPYMGGTPNFPQGVMPFMPSAAGLSSSLGQLLSSTMGMYSPASALSSLLGGYGGGYSSGASSVLGGTSAMLSSLTQGLNPLSSLYGLGSSSALGTSSLSSLLSGLGSGSSLIPGTSTSSLSSLAPLLGGTSSSSASSTSSLSSLLSSLLGGSASSTATAGSSSSLSSLLSGLLGGGLSSSSVSSLLKALGISSPTVAGPTPVSTSTSTTTPTTTTTTTPTTTITSPTVTSTPTTVTTGAGPTNTAWGDPHFVYKHNGKTLQFDFQGEANKVYNLFKDGSININSKFKAWKGHKGATVMESFGFNLNGKKLQVEKGKATLDGVALEKGKEYFFDTGIAIPDKPGETYKGSIKTDGKNVTVNAGEYIFTAKDQGEYFDLDAQVTNIGSRANGLDAIGVLGETFDSDHKNYGKGGKTGANAQGEGYLNFGGNGGTGYLADDLFDNTHNYTEDKHDVKLGVGSGQTGTGTK